MKDKTNLTPLEKAILEREKKVYAEVVRKAFLEVYNALVKYNDNAQIKIPDESNQDELAAWINELKPTRSGYYGGYHIALGSIPEPPEFLAEAMISQGVKEILEKVDAIESIRSEIQSD